MNVAIPRRKGTYAPRGGKCRWCGCTFDKACPQGCAWDDEATQTLCSACVAIDQAWQALEAAKLPNMHRAFFRGFVVGAGDERATADENPYALGGDSRRYWDQGHTAGTAAG